MPEYDIAIIGSVCSGKTSLIQWLQGKQYSFRSYYPTLQKQEYQVKLGSQTLWILDCPATERPDKDDAVKLLVVCFNLASQFDQLRTLELMKYYQKQDIIIIATKADEAIYSEKEFYQFCQAYKVPIEKTLIFSAKTGLHGDLLKKVLLDKVRQKQKPIDIIKHELNRNHLFYKKLLVIENKIGQAFYQYDVDAKSFDYDLIKNALAYYLSQCPPLYQQRSDSEHGRLKEQFLAIYDRVWAKYSRLQPEKWYSTALQAIEPKIWVIVALTGLLSGVIVAYVAVCLSLIINPVPSMLWLPLLVAPLSGVLIVVCGFIARELYNAGKKIPDAGQLNQGHLKEDLIELIEFTANGEESQILSNCPGQPRLNLILL